MPDPYLTPEQARDRHSDIAGSKYSGEQLAELIAEFEGKVERYRGHAAVPRQTVETHVLDLPGRTCLVMEWPLIRSVDLVELDGEPVPSEVQVDRRAGIIHFPGRRLCAGAWTITYTHGLTTPTSAHVRACGLYVRREALASANPSTGNTFMTTNVDLGIVERAATADPDAGRLTGWMDVDRIVNGIEDLRGGRLA